jgi:hypothetical protein
MEGAKMLEGEVGEGGEAGEEIEEEEFTEVGGVNRQPLDLSEDASGRGLFE